jgi:hypothetical protein
VDAAATWDVELKLTHDQACLPAANLRSLLEDIVTRSLLDCLVDQRMTRAHTFCVNRKDNPARVPATSHSLPPPFMQ